ncbi:MAG: glycosyltransferase family 4 protein [Candidatus Magnetoovum sp. WYHC-5]|nr:glycosyltransferase family 4 protein [Candidatus Magnetoovum sp. WYHC-5]
MKIALYDVTATMSYGGVQTFVWAMANALACRGHVVHVYGGDGNIKNITEKGIEVYTYPYVDRRRILDLGTRFRKFGERLSFFLNAYKDVINRQYDIIYIQKPYDLPFARFISKKTNGKTKVVFSSHGTEFYPGYKAFVSKVDYFFACSKYNANEVEGYCGIKPVVLYNAVDTELFCPTAPDAQLRRSLGITDEVVLVSACRLVGWKGIQIAIMAMAKISKTHRVKYLVIGEGEYMAELKRLTMKEGLESHVLFLGKVLNTELPSYYNISDIAVYPSLADETFGIAIAEAMACGLAVVSTAVGGIPEVIEGATGVLVPPSNIDLLAEALLQLINDAALRKDIGFAGRRRIVNRFSWDSTARMFEEYVGHV